MPLEHPDRDEIELTAVLHALSDPIRLRMVRELARQGRQVAYNVLDVQGPPHDRTFTCAAVIDGEEVGVGKGRSKKAAEQSAAKQALDRLAGA